MAQVNSFSVQPVSMVSKAGLQRVDITYSCSAAMHLFLEVYRGEIAVVKSVPVHLNGGSGSVTRMLPVQPEEFDALWRLIDRAGNTVAEVKSRWTRPRERTMYIMLSSHTDIGLHNSQYIQRYNSSRFLDMAQKLCDETDSRAENDRYRYTIEGTWFWNNYGMDRGQSAAQAVVRDYVKPGKIGICCGVAGNHTQVYGLEEMCRSAYEKKRLQDTWNVDSQTMTMIDNNGMSMGLIQPYAEAGVKNIIFAPNHWNPLPSTIWKMDYTKPSYTWNTNAGGGGARIEIRYDSQLPMVFYWEGTGGKRVLVWGSTQYSHGSTAFGLFARDQIPFPQMEDVMAKQLPQLDEKYPYDVWLMGCYADDQEPEMRVTDRIRQWNAAWQWPKLRTLGDPDEPFRILREKHSDQIPVLKGDITGGWYQHPVSTPELLAQKFAVDRQLPNGEKWSAVAAALDETYTYPAEQFRRAWDYLLFNDEHSYGTSGYQGRRVYETWMQHRDWIQKAEETAREESISALRAIAGMIPAEKDSIVVFNPTACSRRELVETEDGKSAVLDIPAFGYRVAAVDTFTASQPVCEETVEPPVIENRFYKVTFSENGPLDSVFDKTLGRELLTGKANELLYTRDNHKTFQTPEKAAFQILRSPERITVTVKTAIENLGAEIVQTISLPSHEKRIDIDNRLCHVKDMINRDRYHRYLYCAFPFGVESCRRYCHVNGGVAEYAKDVTGHGTDVYMAVNEWCCAENEDFGVALLMLDSQLMEFDHIHPDKTDFAAAGEGSQMFAYLANDWLQMHTPGGSHLDFRFRYRITSYTGGYQKANVPQMAERFANPVETVKIPRQTGSLDGVAHSFLRIPTGQRLIGLKRADDGNGIIARVYGEQDTTSFELGFGNHLSAKRVRIDESPLAEPVSDKGFATYRIGGGALHLEERVVAEVPGVGSVYTGLITEPCAAAGENAGHLYLLWGQSMEADFSHYKLYRSEHSGFTPDETTFVADVLPEEYRVGRYEDTGLKEHTCYYYRVCAVNKQGIPGSLSREFSGFTRESLL